MYSIFYHFHLLNFVLCIHWSVENETINSFVEMQPLQMVENPYRILWTSCRKADSIRAKLEKNE